MGLEITQEAQAIKIPKPSQMKKKPNRDKNVDPNSR